MRGALITIVIIGVGIGAMMPASRDRAAPAPVATAPTEGASEARVETVLHRRGDSHFYTEAQVNGQPVDFVVDTGASAVVLTVEDARRIGIDVRPDQFQVVGMGASGEVRGQTVMLGSVMLDGKRVHEVRGAVLEGLTISLLGQSYLKHIGSIEVRGDEMRLK